MKVDGALKGGIAGITTLGILTETLGKVNGNSSHFNLLNKGKLKKRLKKTGSKNNFKATKQYIQLAEDILGSAAYLGINSLAKKKNTMMKGGLLGAAAGLGNIFLHDSSHRNGYDHVGSDSQMGNDVKLSSKLLKLSLYTIGGLIAGRLAQNMNKKKKRKK